MAGPRGRAGCHGAGCDHRAYRLSAADPGRHTPAGRSDGLDERPSADDHRWGRRGIRAPCGRDQCGRCAEAPTLARGVGDSEVVAGGFVVGTYLFALAVSPIVTATAPHDQLTERTIATAGRVVVFVDPVPSAQSVARLRSNPLVTGTAAMTRHGCCSPGIETPTGTWLVRSCPRPRRA